MRKLIKEADPGVVEEWKWMGTPVWSNRAIDLCEGEEVDASAFKALIRAAVALNTPRKSRKNS